MIFCIILSQKKQSIRLLDYWMEENGMKKKDFMIGGIVILSPTLLLILLALLPLFFNFFISFIMCTVIEKEYYDGRYELAEVYTEVGILTDQRRVHCVYEDEEGFSFEIIGYYEWWFYLIPVWGFESTYIPSVMEAKSDEVRMLNEEYADVLCWKRDYDLNNIYDVIIPIGNMDEYERNEYIAEYVCRLDELYNFQINMPDRSSGMNFYFTCTRGGYVEIDGERISYSYSEDERLTLQDVTRRLY